MNNKIAVVGAGCASLTAAAILSSRGYDVTVYEKMEETDFKNERAVSFDPDLLEICGVGLPPRNEWLSASSVSVYSPSLSTELHRHIPESRLNIKMLDGDLINHLISHAKECGVKFIFGCEAESLIIFGERAVGIKTNSGEVYANLVIDGAGLNSRLRRSLPNGVKIPKSISPKDISYTYFARCSKPENVLVRDKYRTVIFPDGSRTIARIETEENFTDVYITGFEPMSKAQINSIFDFLKSFNPSVGDGIICGGKVYKSPSRVPMHIPLCDGYAAVGSASFAADPFTGEGVSEELMQAKLLSKAVCRDKRGIYDKEALWGSQSDYFIVAGKNLMAFSAVKKVLLSLSDEEIDGIFQKKLITSKDLSFDMKKPFSSFNIQSLTEKLKLLNDDPILFKKLSHSLPQILSALALGETFPRKWNDYTVNLWLKGAKFFE